MANISMNSKEVEAIYFLIGSQEAHLESCDDKEYVALAYNSIRLATDIIKKYVVSNKKRITKSNTKTN